MLNILFYYPLTFVNIILLLLLFIIVSEFWLRKLRTYLYNIPAFILSQSNYQLHFDSTLHLSPLGHFVCHKNLISSSSPLSIQFRPFVQFGLVRLQLRLHTRTPLQYDNGINKTNRTIEGGKNNNIIIENDDDFI